MCSVKDNSLKFSNALQLLIPVTLLHSDNMGSACSLTYGEFDGGMILVWSLLSGEETVRHTLASLYEKRRTSKLSNLHVVCFG